MTIGTIRAAIVAKVSAVPDVGRVHAYERYLATMNKLRELYADGPRIRGWLVTRVSTRELPDTTNTVRNIHRWSVRGYHSLDDDAGTELEFSNLVEQVRAAFRWDETLGDVCETTAVDGRSGLQLDDFGPVMFAGVLCHGARLSIDTQEIVAADPGQLDDFITGNVRWDLAPTDGVVDAEDMFTLEAP